MLENIWPEIFHVWPTNFQFDRLPDGLMFICRLLGLSGNAGVRVVVANRMAPEPGQSQASAFLKKLGIAKAAACISGL